MAETENVVTLFVTSLKLSHFLPDDACTSAKTIERSIQNQLNVYKYPNNFFFFSGKFLFIW